MDWITDSRTRSWAKDRLNGVPLAVNRPSASAGSSNEMHASTSSPRRTGQEAKVDLAAHQRSALYHDASGVVERAHPVAHDVPHGRGDAAVGHARVRVVPVGEQPRELADEKGLPSVRAWMLRAIAGVGARPVSRRTSSATSAGWRGPSVDPLVVGKASDRRQRPPQVEPRAGCTVAQDAREQYVPGLL